MYIYIYMCVCVCACRCAYAYPCLSKFIYVLFYVHIYIYTCVCINLHVGGVTLLGAIRAQMTPCHFQTHLVNKETSTRRTRRAVANRKRPSGSTSTATLIRQRRLQSGAGPMYKVYKRAMAVTAMLSRAVERGGAKWTRPPKTRSSQRCASGRRRMKPLVNRRRSGSSN